MRGIHTKRPGSVEARAKTKVTSLQEPERMSLPESTVFVRLLSFVERGIEGRAEGYVDA